MTGDAQHGGDDAQDPLDGADVGETRTVRRSKTLHSIDFEPDVYYGSDRIGRADIVGVEVIEDDRDGYADDVRITWEADMTKTLPRRWDYARDPRTAEEEKQASRRKWLGRAKKAVGFVAGMTIAWVPAILITSKVTESMTINGQPIGPVGPTEALVTLALFSVVAALVLFGVYGGFPGMAGGRRC